MGYILGVVTAGAPGTQGIRSEAEEPWRCSGTAIGETD
jgi:hypothetical protein